jgi:integrase
MVNKKLTLFLQTLTRRMDMPDEPSNVAYLHSATDDKEPEAVWLKDKNIKLERRAYKNRNWQARLRIPGAKYKYDRVTTGTPDLDTAKRFALDRFERLNWRHQNGYSIFAPTFAKMAKSYVATFDRQISIGELNDTKAKDSKRRLDNFLLPFFSNTMVTEITDNAIQNYHVWRLEQWQKDQIDTTLKPVTVKGGQTKYMTRKHLQKPSRNSQVSDELVIARVLDHAVFKKEIKPEEKPHFTYTKLKWARRGTFTNEEWKSIYTALRALVKRKANNRSLLYSMQMFRHFCLIMANAGTRPNELLHVKWSDITPYIDEDGEQQMELRIRDVGDPRKHRPRSYPPLPVCLDYFNRLRAIHHDPSPENYVFVTWRGEQIRGYATRFSNLMKDLDLYVDAEGQKRTPYSLRHYYATTRLEHGADPYLLSQFMGTSLAMIEKTYAHILNRRAAKAVNQRRSRKPKQSVQSPAKS